METQREFADVHDAHCCKKHGACKYGDENCTVVNGPNPGIRGECCDYADERYKHFMEEHPEVARAMTTVAMLNDYFRLAREGKPSPSPHTVLIMLHETANDE